MHAGSGEKTHHFFAQAVVYLLTAGGLIRVRLSLTDQSKLSPTRSHAPCCMEPRRPAAWIDYQDARAWTPAPRRVASEEDTPSVQVPQVPPGSDIRPTVRH